MSFLDLHVPGDPLLIPNPWDVGAARLFQSLGARALATTSGGFAAALGRADGDVTLDEVLVHCAAVAMGVDVPITADFEHGFADDLESLARNVTAAAGTGLAGLSLEDWSGHGRYDASEAVARVQVARDAAPDLVLTARTEGYLHGNPSLNDAISRLQAFAEAGADVLYAPGLTDLGEIRTLCAEVPRPVNVLLLGDLTVPALADAGVARISVGGALAWTAWEAASAAAQEFLAGESAWLATARAGRAAAARVIG